MPRLTRRIFIMIVLLAGMFSALFSQSLLDSLNQEMMRSRGPEKVRLLNELADAWLRQSPEKTIEYASMALEQSMEIKRADLQAEALNNLGKAYYFTGDYQKAGNYYLESARIAEENRDELSASKCYNNLGVLYRSQGDFDRALEYYNKALDIRRKLNDLQGIARTLNNVGEIQKFRGDYANAMLNYQESYQLKKELGDIPGMANTLNNLGEIHNYWGDYQKSLEYYQESYTLRTSMDDKQGMATSIFNIGLIYTDLGNMDQALKYIGESLALYEQIGEKSGMAFCLDKLGEIYLERDQYELARDYFDRSLRIQEELGNIQGKANSLKNISSVMYRQGELNQSILLLNQALEIYQENRDQKGIADLLQRLGDVYLAGNNVITAIEYYNRSLRLSSELKIKAIEQGNYQGMTNAYSRLEDYKTALEYYKLFVQIRDSISNEAIQKNINELNTRYQTEKKEIELERTNLELAQREVEIRQKNLQQYGLMAVILLVLLLAAALYRGYYNKQKANLILSRQKAEIEQKNREITDSIMYAKHIQNAILPHATYLQDILPGAFIYYRPKAIVSGDFYWMEKVGDAVYVAAVDATGHGVPGAFISLLGFNILNTALKESPDLSPAGILDSLNRGFSERLSKSHPDEHIKDSMDLALCKIDHKAKILEYAGAYNPLWIVRGKELTEIKADKFPVGTYLQNSDRKYTNHRIKLEKEDMIYLFSDGYADQFGGSEGKKFRYKRLAEVLISHAGNSLQEQEAMLEQAMQLWMGPEEQIDDMLIIGIRI